MANTLLTIDMITRKALEILENNLVLTRNVNRQYDDSYAVEGAKIVGGAREAGNSEAVGWALYREYFLPFEIASVFLLVAMIGAVVLGKRTMDKVD